MSLFHVQDWFKTEVDEGRFVTVSNLLEHRDQVLVGCLNGTVAIFDPGKDVDNRHETALLIEKRLAQPVLQMLVGRFLASYDENLIAILHPKSLTFYRLSSVDEVSFTLDHIFEHKLKAGPAFNMCLGEFSRSQYFQIYVQSMNCSLSIYEAENHLLDRQMLNAIHPGPIVYAPGSQTLYNASGGYLAAYPHNSFTSAVATNQKKMASEWSFNLGDTAVELVDMDVAPIQPSLLVLCRRCLFCVTHGGSPRFMIRLQCVATALLAYKTTSDPFIQLCVGTATKTLLFYRDTTMIWSAQLDFTPTAILLSSFSDSLRGMLTCLSDDCRLLIGYLGTEPSLFRMPITEARFIDFEQRRQELENFEREIKTYSKDANVSTGRELELEASVFLDKESVAFDTFEDVSSATVRLSVQCTSNTVDIAFQSYAFAPQDYFTVSTSQNQSVLISVFVKGKPVMDSRFLVVATTRTGEAALIEGHLPLKLFCYETGALRNAQVKLSLDSNTTGLEIRELYPEFDTENQSSLGLQPYGSEVVVSVFSAVKNGRYRVQSDSTEFLYLVFDDLIRRIKNKQPEAKLSAPVPLHLFVNGIVQHVELEKRCDLANKEVQRVSIQMRHVETMLLNKLKAERDDSMTPINVLVNYTYRELLTALDKLRAAEIEVEKHKEQGLHSLLNLMKLCMELSGIQMPFDGRIMDGSDQKLAECIAPLLGHKESAADVDAATITQLLVSFCEQGGRLANITEVPEEEELDEQPHVTATGELVELESGALSVPSLITERADY